MGDGEFIPVIRFFVPGLPRPGGSKTARVIRRKGGEIVTKNGRPLITMRDDAKGNAEWKSLVAYFANAAVSGRKGFSRDPGPEPDEEYQSLSAAGATSSEILTSTLSLHVIFTMPRIKAHFRKDGSLRPAAPKYHTVKPDATKLTRSTEDACTGIVWSDDALIAKQSITKVYGDRPGAEIVVSVLRDAAAVACPAPPAQVEGGSLFKERIAS